MSIYEKTLEKISPEIIEKYQKKYPLLCHRVYQMSDMGTDHEVLFVPLSYEKYVKVIKTQYDKMDYDKYDEIKMLPNAVLCSYIVYPELDIEEDFKDDENPIGFLESLLFNIEQTWEIVETETIYYIDDKIINPITQIFYDKYDEELSKATENNKFSVGVKLENQYKQKQFFIYSKITNSEKNKIINLAIQIINDLFESSFSKYSSSLRNQLEAAKFEDKKINIATLVEKNGELEERLRLDLAKYNDQITLLTTHYIENEIYKILIKKVTYSFPMSIADVPFQFLAVIFDLIQQPFILEPTINFKKCKNELDEFCKENSIDEIKVIDFIVKIQKIIQE